MTELEVEMSQEISEQMREAELEAQAQAIWWLMDGLRGSAEDTTRLKALEALARQSRK